MSETGNDRLAFLTSRGGVVGTPLAEAPADGADNLDSSQRSAVIGEPIPIVFCRRVGGIGGVLVSPPATEARFSDNVSSDITASYHLVLSEGQIDPIQIRDLFQRSCRVGSFTHTYDRRAGTFVAGNFVDNTPDLEVPTYCGTSGSYAGLSTMAFSVTIPAGFDQWSRQVHCFVRGGIHVPRLLDGITGPSNNVVDLLLYLMRNSSRVPDAMIDTANFLAAATFTNVNGFWFNGVLSESTNLRDWIGNTLQYFLLRQTRFGGKESLKPLVQTNGNGTIKTTAVSWVFTFTEEHVIPGSFGIVYTPLADRKPFCAVMLWRQQDDLGIPVMRTTEVRYTGTAADGPFEQHDLSGFCSSENHAVKVGAYILAKRSHVNHRLQLGVKPDSFNATLAVGDIVRVRLARVASTGAPIAHDYLYEVDRIGKSFAGEVRLDLTHFPIDENRASVVAQEVNAAIGGGLTIATGLSAVTCDINASNDTAIPPETFTPDTSFNEDLYEFTSDPVDEYGFGTGDFGTGDFGTGDFGTGDFGIGTGGFGTDGSGIGGSGDGDGGTDNPADGTGGGGDPGSGGSPGFGSTGDPNSPQTGDTLTAPTICEGAQIVFYRKDPSVPGGTVIAAGASHTYTLQINDVDKSVYADIRCPDKSSPDGLGPATTIGPTPIIAEAPTLGEQWGVLGSWCSDGTTPTNIYLTAPPAYNNTLVNSFIIASVTADVVGIIGYDGQLYISVNVTINAVGGGSAGYTYSPAGGGSIQFLPVALCGSYSNNVTVNNPGNYPPP